MDAQSAVQQLLLDHGAYSPVELLLAMGLLPNRDHVAWRRGETATLDAAFEDRSAVRGLLESAAAFARNLGLSAEAVTHEGREDGAGLDRRASSDRQLDTLLRTHYRRVPAEGDRQLDLWLDSGTTVAVNDLLGALLKRDPDAAGRALTQLAGLNPDPNRERWAATLIEALRSRPPTDHDLALDQLERMQMQWVPAASQLLVSRAPEFLRPLWQGIASGLDPARFEAGDGERHVSWIHRQCFDWERVRDSILAVPTHADAPVLIERLAEAECRLRNRVAAVAHWFALGRSAPERLKAALDSASFPDSALLAGWRAARASGLEPEITTAWFPAWMLLREPGLARALDFVGGARAPDRAFDSLKALLTSDSGNTERRADLQSAHPGLLAEFLALRG